MITTHSTNRCRPYITLGVLAAALAAIPSPSLAADRLPRPNPEQLKYFESKVRPILEENCVSCHGAQKQKGGLRLDSAAGVLKGGKEGAILVPGKPDESPFVTAISYKDADLQMPPDNPLAAEQVQALTDWVRMGAPWPEKAVIAGNGALNGKIRTITDDDRTFWSFQPVKAVAPPEVAADQSIRKWCRNPIDRFIGAKLAGEGLTPAAEADRATLVRRLTFDLHGLPPTPAEVAAFVADASPTAYEDLVDRLLASPRYGEHWARHWLDLVRYAESDGFKQDAYRANAWPYRDYVIQSFNDDKPYDRFVTEQLAGDEIAPNDPNVVVATGYFRGGIYEYNNRDVQRQWSEMLTDVTDVTADAFLGLSMGCARCHDHKFDPILQSDYYRLRGFFAPMLPRNDVSLASAEEKAVHAKALAAWEKKAAPLREKMIPFEKAAAEKTAKAAIKKFPEEMQAILFKPATERTPLEEQLAQLANRQVADPSENPKPKLTGADKEKYEALKKQLAELEVDKPKPLPVALITTDIGPVAPPTVLPGDAAHPLDPGYLTVLGKLPLANPEIKPSENSTGRRTALAKWITQPDNPLTSRVAVNRIWQYHFGRGIVATSSDFGRLGSRPTHPELLDYLAKQFVDDGWSFKKMHRLILTSATYRQTALRPMPEAARLKDPENRWLWRMNSRRLDAEQVRDAMLAASGELLPRSGGPSAEPSAPVRTIYTKVLRNTRDALLDAFDSPESFGSVANRNVTTTASQALLMINGDWPLKRASAFAGRLYQQATGSDPASLVEAAYRIAYGRPPRAEETKLAVAFLEREARPGTQVVATAGDVADAPVTQTMPQRGGQAVLVRNANPADMLRLPEPCSLGSGDFTVEAFVQLESVYEDAKVRVITAEWDGDQKHAGWALGVTSQKSKHQPRNLILQVVNEAGAYEVVPSDLKVEPHKAYYVAVSVKAGKGGAAGATFYTKDLTDMDAGLKSAHVPWKAGGPCVSKSPLTIGGRLGDTSSKGAQGWDGLIDEVRISSTALGTNDLLYNDGDPGDVVCGHWLLKERPGFFKDSSGRQKDLRRAAAPTAGVAKSAGTPKSVIAALVDFCHVLLNSNEFLYVD